MIEKESISLPDAEILAQLAEEAAELAQAALKMRRAITGMNPTPVAKESAHESLVEEVSDVALCLELLEVKPDDAIMLEKHKRWEKRLREAQQ